MTNGKLQITFSISDIVDGALKYQPSSRNPYISVHDSVTGHVIKAIFAGDNIQDIQQRINQVMLTNKEQIKQGIKEDIARRSGSDWDDIKSQDSFGMSRTQRINHSFNVTKAEIISSAIRNKNRYNAMLKHLNKGDLGILKRMGIKGKTDEELLRNIATNLATAISTGNTKTFDHTYLRLVKTESHAVRHLKNLDKLRGKPVTWKTEADGRVCSRCAPYSDMYFSDASKAPMIPVHPYCRCWLEEVDI